jgi:hypothetical protein
MRLHSEQQETARLRSKVAIHYPKQMAKHLKYDIGSLTRLSVQVCNV